jgi:CRP-like cAMP-binding protein
MAMGTSTMNISFFRIVPTSVKLVDERYAGGRGETQMFAGAEFQVDNVYNVLDDLPVSEQGSISGKLQRQEVEAGATIARQGAPADKFVIVIDGEVEAVRESDGQSGTVATLGPGDFFGEVSILTEAQRTATLQAKSASTILTMDRDEFTSVVGQALGTPEFDSIIRSRFGGGE